MQSVFTVLYKLYNHCWVSHNRAPGSKGSVSMRQTSKDHNQNAKQAQTWIDEAIAATKAKETVKCLKCITHAAALEHDDARLWFRNGLLFFSLDRYDEALRCYDQALRINSQFGKVWFNMGLLDYV